MCASCFHSLFLCHNSSPLLPCREDKACMFPASIPFFSLVTTLLSLAPLYSLVGKKRMCVLPAFVPVSFPCHHSSLIGSFARKKTLFAKMASVSRSRLKVFSLMVFAGGSDGEEKSSSCEGAGGEEGRAQGRLLHAHEEHLQCPQLSLLNSSVVVTTTA